MCFTMTSTIDRIGLKAFSFIENCHRITVTGSGWKLLSPNYTAHIDSTSIS